MSWDRFDEFALNTKQGLEGLNSKLGGLTPSPEANRSAWWQQFHRDMTQTLNGHAQGIYNQQGLENQRAILAELRAQNGNDVLTRSLQWEVARMYRSYNQAYAMILAYEKGDIVNEDGHWQNWRVLKSAPITKPVQLALSPDRRLEMFSVDSYHNLVHAYQPVRGGAFTDMGSLGGHLSNDICVGTNDDGRLEVFARGQNNQVYNKWQNEKYGGWSEWGEMGGEVTSNLVVKNIWDGRLQLFGVGPHSQLHSRHQERSSEGWSWWSDWENLQGQLKNKIEVGTNRNKALEVFALGVDDQMHHKWQEEWGGWSDWVPFGGRNIRNFKVGNTADGRQEVFALEGGDMGWNSKLVHKWQEEWGGWSDWHSFSPEGIVGNSLAVINNRWGHLEVFASGAQTTMLHKHYNPEVGWSKWVSHPGSFFVDDIAISPIRDRIGVIARDRDTGIYHFKNQSF